MTKTISTKIKTMNWKSITIWTLALLPVFALSGVAIWASLPTDTMTAQIGIRALEDLDPIAKGFAVIGGGLAGLGMFGAGIGQGYAAGKAAEAVSRNPEAEAKIRSMFLVGAAIAESSALYGFVIAIMTVFVV